MKRILYVLIAWFELPLILRERFLGIETMLTQIYGELNRIRLIMSDKNETGKKIQEFDKIYNKYFPFFDSKKNYDKYKACKGETK